MQKIISITAMFLLLTFASLTADAQEKEKPETPKTSTVDTWRTALPVSEQPTVPKTVDETNPTNTTADNTESSAEIEKKILELEKSLMDSIKIRDTETLQSLIADNFLLTGINIAGTKTDKVRFINWTAKSFELKTYTLGKTTVRAYPTTAIVSYTYKRQANIAGKPADGDFVVTDVWIKGDNNLWQTVSHHISQLPKP